MRTNERCVLAAASLLFVVWTPLSAAVAQTDPPPPPPSSQARTSEPAETRRPAYTSTADLSDVRPLVAWIEDAVTTEGVDIEPRLSWGKGGSFNRLVVEALTAVWVTQGLEVGGVLGLTSFDPDFGSGSTGANDVTLYGRYVFNQQPNFAAGAKFDIPVGKEEVGQSTFDFSVFGAYRQTLGNGMGVHANVAMESLEFERFGGSSRENGLRVGGGVIVPVTTEISALGELSIGTADDTFLIIGGMDWELPPGGHLRGGLLLNADDGAEDFRIFVSFSIPVY